MIGKRNVLFSAAHSLGLSEVVASSDLLLTTPSMLVRSLMDGCPGLELRQLPFKLAPLTIRQQWHEGIHLDGGNRWLRGLFFSLFHKPVIQPGLVKILVDANAFVPDELALHEGDKDDYPMR